MYLAVDFSAPTSRYRICSDEVKSSALIILTVIVVIPKVEFITRCPQNLTQVDSNYILVLTSVLTSFILVYFVEDYHFQFFELIPIILGVHSKNPITVLT